MLHLTYTYPIRCALPKPFGGLNRIAIHQTKLYHLTITFSVSPPKYAERFTMDSSSGVVAVSSAIDREELDGALITISIKVPDRPFSAKHSLVVVGGVGDGDGVVVVELW